MASQDDSWSGERVRRWLAQAEGLDRQMAPITDLLFQGLALAPGERVLDVGCGSGPTTRRAAELVAPGGWVAGIDVSAGMLEAAATVPTANDAVPIEWIEADVAAWRPTVDPVDVVMSRFGVMFFEDPPAAFANLAAACRPGGRLCVVVWDRRDRSALFQVPLAATSEVLTERGVPLADLPVDGGAFSLSEPAHVKALLEGAGWADVEAVPHTVSLPVGGGLPPAEAAGSAVSIGPSRVLTEDVDDEVRAAVVEAIAEALAAHVDPTGQVVLEGSVVLVSARRP